VWIGLFLNLAIRFYYLKLRQFIPHLAGKPAGRGLLALRC